MIALAQPPVADLVALDGPRAQLDRYVTYLAEDRCLAPNSVQAYATDLAQLVRFVDAQLPGCRWTWAAVTARRLEAFVADLGARGFSPASVARKVAALKTFFRWLLEQGLVALDPTGRLLSAPVPWRAPRVLADRELAALLAQPARRRGPEGLRDAALLRLLRATGARVSELVGLDLEDLDLATDYARILRAGPRVRERHVPFDPPTHDALVAYLAAGRPRLAAHEAAGRTPALLLNQRGGRLTRQGVCLIVTTHARAAGIAGPVSPGALRHSYAVDLLARGAEARDVQTLLGHATLQTTQLYATMVGGRLGSIEEVHRDG